MISYLRALFLVFGMVLGYAVAYNMNGEKAALSVVEGAIPGALFAGILVALEAALARRFLQTAIIVVVGVIFGFIVGGLFTNALILIPQIKMQAEQYPYLQVAVTLMFSIASVIGLLHVKDEFKLQIPFVEFTRQKSTGRPLLLDTSAIIDGRVVDLIETGILDATVIIPRFVLAELHRLSDSQEKLKRNRGRRGLELLNRIRETKKVQIETPDVELPAIEGVDNKLISMARTTNARILTTDLNLEKVAQVQGVDAVNLHSLERALRPAVSPGERITIELIKQGENPGQGVGFLEDGTMVVAEGCAHRVGQTVALVVKNVFPTPGGRIIFGEPEEVKAPPRR